MKDRSLLHFFIRLLVSTAMVLLLALLYWSSLLQEERLAGVEDQLKILQKELKALPVTKEAATFPSMHSEVTAKNRPHIDHSLPNLLQQDPYFTQTLPKLLGPNFRPQGTLRMASIGVPQNLHPFSQWAQVSEWTNYCQGAIANQKFGFYETLAQDFAIKMEKRATDRPDRVAFWIHLREGLFWQPLEQRHFPATFQLSRHFLQKHPVTAHDFQFFFDALSNTHVDVPEAVTLRFLLRDIERVETIDDLTFVVTCKLTTHVDDQGKAVLSLPYAVPFYVAQLRPLARFVYQYNQEGFKICSEDSSLDFYRLSSTWAQGFANHFASRVIVSCGPWIFDGISESQIRFRRNSDYFSPVHALYDTIEIYFLETQDAIFRDFVAQKIDLCMISPQNLIELENFLASPRYSLKKQQGLTVKRLDYLQRRYTYVGWNEKNELFKSSKVRRALTMAIDRSRLIRQNLNGKGVEITGPFFFGSSEYNPTLAPIPYDPDLAKLLLAEAGWSDSDANGVLNKVINGKDEPFRFTLIYYVKDAVGKINCEQIAQFLKQIGVQVDLNGLDVADISQNFEDKSFDAIYLSWSLGSPPEDPRQLWHSEGALVKGSSNMIGFQNMEVDRLIERLQYESDLDTRKNLFWRMHDVLYKEQPYSFLFSPMSTLIWWSNLRNIFIPKDRQDLVPGATVEQPAIMYSWKKE